MLLAMDVGNTHTVIGALDEQGTVMHRWRVSTRAWTTDELGMLLRQLLRDRELSASDVHRTIVCCVAPSVRYTVDKACRRYLQQEPLMVGSGVRTGMRVRTDNPREVGPDRIVNAIAAFARWGGPVVVIGLNTATTVDCVNANGEYVGGAIAPGFRISADALFSQTARLPHVEAERTAGVIGTNTIQSMQAGMFWGYVGLVDGLALRSKQELAGEDVWPRCVATGQMAHFVGRDCKEIDEIDESLTLRGLHLVSERNGRRGGRR